ncbi:MAG: PQQ-binding-like beta-propeller repeat protein, partial [Ktedonobacterales bacterium]
FHPAAKPRVATPDPGALRIRWHYTLGFSAAPLTGSDPQDSPVGLAADTTAVYATSPTAQELRALSVRDGSVLWRFGGDDAAGIAGIYGTYILQASADRLFLLAEINTGSALKLLCLEKASGKLLWQSAAIGTSYNYSDLCIANGAVYFQNAGTLYGYSQDGHPLWPALPLFPFNENTSSSLPYSTPAFANGMVYVGINNGGLIAVNATTGALVWSATLASTQSGFVSGLQFSPAVANGLVYVGATDGYVHALDAATGAARWKTKVVNLGQVTDEYGFLGAPLVSGGVVYVQPGLTDGTATLGGTLCALQATSGKLLWQVDPSKLPLLPHIADVGVYPNIQPATMSGGNVYWTVTLLPTDTNQVGAQALIGLHPQDGSLQSYFLSPISGISSGNVAFPSPPVPVPGGLALLNNTPALYVLDT